MGSLVGMIDDRQTISKVLLIFAWIVEVVAVILGLTIAIITAVVSFEQMGMDRTSDWLNAIVGTLPFVMIALVEITKIPLTGAAFYSKSKKWKALFVTSLLFVALITFETMFTSLERFFNAQTDAVIELKNEQKRLESELERNQERLQELGQVTRTTIEEDFEKVKKNADALLEQSRIENKSVEDEISRSVATKSLENKEDNRSRLIAEIAKAKSSRDEELEAARQRHEKEIAGAESSLRTGLNRCQNDLDEARARYQRIYEESNIIFRSGRLVQPQEDIDRATKCIEDYQARIIALNTGVDSATGIEPIEQTLAKIARRNDLAIAKKEQELEKIEKEIASILGASSDAAKKAREELAKKREKDREIYESRIRDAMNDKNRRLTEIETVDAEIAKIGNENVEIGKQLTKVKNDFNRVVQDTQIYRLAKSAVGAEQAADVSPMAVTVVATIWYGSLSAIAAFTGIILAAASFAISDKFREGAAPATDSYLRKLAKSLRRFVLAVRKKARRTKVVEVVKEVVVEHEKPVEVVKEVPVDKVVFRDVPVEVIRREIVHLPIYTNDPELLGKGKEVV